MARRRTVAAVQVIDGIPAGIPVPAWLPRCFVEDWVSEEELRSDGWKLDTTGDSDPNAREFSFLLLAWRRWIESRREWATLHGLDPKLFPHGRPHWRSET